MDGSSINCLFGTDYAAAVFARVCGGYHTRPDSHKPWLRYENGPKTNEPQLCKQRKVGTVCSAMSREEKRRRRRRPRKKYRLRHPRPVDESQGVGGNQNNGRGGDGDDRLETDAYSCIGQDASAGDMAASLSSGHRDHSSATLANQPKDGNGKTGRVKGYLQESTQRMQTAPTHRQFRRAARDVATILQFRDENGEPVVAPEEAKALIRASVVMAGKAAKSGDRVNWPRNMRVVVDLARLEQQDAPAREEHLHLHAELSQEEKLAYVQETLRRECIRRGLLPEVKPGGNGNGDGNGKERKG